MPCKLVSMNRVELRNMYYLQFANAVRWLDRAYWLGILACWLNDWMWGYPLTVRFILPDEPFDGFYDEFGGVAYVADDLPSAVRDQIGKHERAHAQMRSWIILGDFLPVLSGCLFLASTYAVVNFAVGIIAGLFGATCMLSFPYWNIFNEWCANRGVRVDWASLENVKWF